MSRSANWYFTINNYSPEDVQILQNLECDYITYGYEVAPTTGTPHLHVYVEFDRKRMWSYVRSVIPERSSKLEVRWGTQQQMIEYCQEEGNFIERGQKKNQGSRTDLDGVRVLALENGLREVTRRGNSQQIAVATKFLTYHEEPRTWKTMVCWLWGDTGTGKTLTAHKIAGDDVYVKSGDAKWFDGYDAHESVIFDDLREDTFKFDFLLALLDRFPVRVEIKGGYRQFKPRLIVITCPFSPEVFQIPYGEDRQQLLRRIDVVEHFVSRCPEVAGNN